MKAFIQMDGKEVPINFVRKISVFVNITLSSTLETGNQKLANIAAIFKRTLSSVDDNSCPKVDEEETDNSIQISPVN